MSALGHKRTFAVQNGMSGLPPKADMCSATKDVRFVPKADISLQVAALHDMIAGVAYLLSKMTSAGLIFPEARSKLDVISS